MTGAAHCPSLGEASIALQAVSKHYGPSRRYGFDDVTLGVERRGVGRHPLRCIDDEEACERISVGPRASGLFPQAIARAGRDVCVYDQEFCIPPNDRALRFPEHTLAGGAQ